MARKAKRSSFAPRLEPLEGRALLSTTTADRLLVGLDSSRPNWAVQQSFRALNAEVIASYPDGPTVVELPPGLDASSAIRRISRLPGVRYVELDGRLQVEGAISNDALINELWGFDQASNIDVDVPEAWSITTGSPGTIVAVIDSGIDLSHPDLVGRIWVNPGEIPGNGRDDDRNGYADDVNGWNFQARTNDVRDQDGHGTHVAGTIAAVANNGIGVAGVAPGIRVMPLKFFGPRGDGAVADAISAIYYAANNGAKVINASWGGTDYSRGLEDAIAFANSRGVVFVTAAGNYARNNDVRPNYPPNINQPNVLSVAAIDRNGALADFSSYGPRTVDVAAPGVSIRSTIPGGRYELYTGTSMATPHVAATVALVAERNPGLTAAQLVERIRSTAKPLPSLAGKILSGGVVSVYNALTGGTTTTAAKPAPSVVTAPRQTVADIREIILGSAEYYQVHGATASSFVNALYQSLLGRKAEPGGVTVWTNALKSGWTRAQVARTIMGTEEAYRTTVARWFVEDLKRPASTLEALKNEPIVIEWAASLARGVSADQIRTQILASDEFYGLNGGEETRFVDGLYRSILGRAAEPAGLELWTSALKLGFRREQVVGMILAAPESRQTLIARWFVSDLKRPAGTLETLKRDPTITSWANNLIV